MFHSIETGHQSLIIIAADQFIYREPKLSLQVAWISWNTHTHDHHDVETEYFKYQGYLPEDP